MCILAYFGPGEDDTCASCSMMVSTVMARETSWGGGKNSPSVTVVSTLIALRIHIYLCVYVALLFASWNINGKSQKMCLVLYVVYLCSHIKLPLINKFGTNQQQLDTSLFTINGSSLSVYSFLTNRTIQENKQYKKICCNITKKQFGDQK